MGYLYLLQYGVTSPPSAGVPMVSRADLARDTNCHTILAGTEALISLYSRLSPGGDTQPRHSSTTLSAALPERHHRRTADCGRIRSRTQSATVSDK